VLRLKNGYTLYSCSIARFLIDGVHKALNVMIHGVQYDPCCGVQVFAWSVYTGAWDRSRLEVFIPSFERRHRLVFVK
jgi:hypothetical protein